MPTVRITTNQGHPAEMKWAGAPALDSKGRLCVSTYAATDVVVDLLATLD